jgi:putative transposase
VLKISASGAASGTSAAAGVGNSTMSNATRLDRVYRDPLGWRHSRNLFAGGGLWSDRTPRTRIMLAMASLFFLTSYPVFYLIAAWPSLARPDRWKTMTLSPHEFIRRFLMHVLPKGFHRILHYGLFANGNRAANVARSRELLGAMPRVVEPEEEQTATPDEPRVQPCTCLRCGAPMIIIEVFARGCQPRYRPIAGTDVDEDRHVMTAARTARRKSYPSRTPLIGRRPPGASHCPSLLAHNNRRPTPRRPFRSSSCPAARRCHPILFPSAPSQQRLLRPNPHRACCNRRCPLSAISCLGASRTPAVGARGWRRHAGVRETCTVMVIQSTRRRISSTSSPSRAAAQSISRSVAAELVAEVEVSELDRRQSAAPGRL